MRDGISFLYYHLIVWLVPMKQYFSVREVSELLQPQDIHSLQNTWHDLLSIPQTTFFYFLPLLLLNLKSQATHHPQVPFQTSSNFSARTESGVRSGRDKRYLNYLQWIEAGVIKKSFKMNIRTTTGDTVEGDPTFPHPHSFILSLWGVEMNGLAIYF